MSRRRDACRRLVVWVMIGAAAACAGRTDAGYGAAQRDEPVVLEVENHNFYDVTVYLMPDGAWHRLGTVTGAGSAQLTVPRGIIPGSMTFRLLVSPIGSPAAYLSEDIQVMPGDIVCLEVSAAIGMSSWWIRRGSSPRPPPASPTARSSHGSGG